jgi:hypothetical protein
MSIITGIVPNQLKIASVIPIHKSADPTELKKKAIDPSAFSQLFQKYLKG